MLLSLKSQTVQTSKGNTVVFYALDFSSVAYPAANMPIKIRAEMRYIKHLKRRKNMLKASFAAKRQAGRLVVRH
ncbi:MAG: hypothetical protein K6G15_06735 [Desulfovibrio sp.]|nr:hypothetical protein [Desulfovibrio sp.]